MIAQSYLCAFLGGALIGLGALAMLLWNGKIAGISGISRGLLTFRTGDRAWRIAFLAGLIIGGGLFFMAKPSAFEIATDRSWPVLAIAGLLVGFGTAMGNGCTSGHGVCGVSRLSRRSIVATVTFIVTGMATATFYKLIVA
jgi:uncharacterized membrane protein YedE/YeeE